MTSSRTANNKGAVIQSLLFSGGKNNGKGKETLI